MLASQSFVFRFMSLGRIVGSPTTTVLAELPVIVTWRPLGPVQPGEFNESWDLIYTCLSILPSPCSDRYICITRPHLLSIHDITLSAIDH